MFFVAGLAAGVSPSSAALAQASAAAPTADQMKAYHATMARTPLPRKGCFKSSFPSTVWTETPCVTPPNRPYPPGKKPRAEIVGEDNDWVGQTSKLISIATGSFDSITGLTSESDGGSNNSFSLQLNTNADLTPPQCKSAKTPSQCTGWQQFVYANSGFAFIQYWLLNYSENCKQLGTGWASYQNDCYFSQDGSSVSPQPIANLPRMFMTAAAHSGNIDFDSVVVSVPGGSVVASNQDSVFGLAKRWKDAEFNVFGDCCGTQANFNGGVTATVRIETLSGNQGDSPSCFNTTYTGETNNLTLSTKCSQLGGTSSAIDFKESNPPASIWLYTGTPCTGSSCPGWQMLDDNNESVRIAAAGNDLYQMHNDGQVWSYTGTPCNGNSCRGWQMLNNNPVALQIATDGHSLNELDNTGKIWLYTGQPCNGSSCPGWQMLDDNPDAATIVVSNGNLYQLHNSGQIWRYTGTPCNGNSCPGWQELDENVATVAIAAEGNNLYQLHNDGQIWRYTGMQCGNACPGWQMLDDNPEALAIVAADGKLYEMHNTGQIWRYTGTPCSGNSCPGWQMLDNNPNAAAMAANGNNLFELRNDGVILSYTGQPCSGNSCLGWKQLDDNSISGSIAAGGGQLYQMHLALQPIFLTTEGGGPPCYACR